MTSAPAMPTTTTPSATPAPRPRVLFALAGFHCVDRGAEVALESVAGEMALQGLADVTLIGAGQARPGDAYHFVHAGRVPRERFERWPRIPVLRSEYAWEEATFAPRLWAAYDPGAYDATITCGYPFTNWVLRAKGARRRPAHIYVTQNGDWPCRRQGSEYRWFSCEGLVCTNPEYYDANRATWTSVLIPNGVDPGRFHPGQVDAAALGIRVPGPRVVMVSALIDSKRVEDGIRAVAQTSDLSLVVAGDGPLRDRVESLGRELLGERFQRVTLPRQRMPDFYRSAHAFLHMSKDEPSANSYIEALATGLPIVTHDRAVTRWTFDSRASLVNSDNLSAVAAALRGAVADGANGRDARLELVARRYAWSSIARDYARFVSSVVLARSGANRT